MTKMVKMAKAGAVLEVHPSCVAAHAAAGWVFAPDVPDEIEEPKRRRKDSSADE